MNRAQRIEVPGSPVIVMETLVVLYLTQNSVYVENLPRHTAAVYAYQAPGAVLSRESLRGGGWEPRRRRSFQVLVRWSGVRRIEPQIQSMARAPCLSHYPGFSCIQYIPRISSKPWKWAPSRHSPWGSPASSNHSHANGWSCCGRELLVRPDKAGFPAVAPGLGLSEQWGQACRSASHAGRLITLRGFALFHGQNSYFPSALRSPEQKCCRNI